MEIYLSPELVTEDAHILNVVNHKHEAVGYLTFIVNQQKMYVLGHCQADGVAEDFKDVIKPYINGMSKLKPDLDVYMTLCVGGREMTLEEEQKS
ncbi:hypothetical protein CathTA2_1299 [Caldalkalibacillus thermarum TA2.A1]|uniref:Uncharacterized protein n=1 Tax=Caldalkalibacillus thermarum (strain TA2.A1) TaxID=986075 RepID=F5L686_CALTT|nr:hypothetical protein [Caldalkalibacillus thermarum]EGL83136.1 hypothetical protein CathTA2_1299 [Caldalkalibacillus thermarum TA2.A1]QZT34834.1 hypothetical protein HUR95_06155 [Caldalkalibacillus thermarum TA2.A1]